LQRLAVHIPFWARVVVEPIDLVRCCPKTQKHDTIAARQDSGIRVASSAAFQFQYHVVVRNRAHMSAVPRKTVFARSQAISFKSMFFIVLSFS
jgi:hypothetical protein